jgi:hypothetical protein
MSRFELHALLVGAAALVVASALAPSAQADVINYSLGTGNSSLSGFTGPFADVTINRTSSTTAVITFTADSNSLDTYLMGGAQAVDVNVNAATFMVTPPIGTNGLAGFSTPGPYTVSGGTNADGFGSFNLNIDSFDGFTHSARSITFGLTDTSGTWGDAADVLAGNSLGNFAAAHIFVCAAPVTSCTASSSNPVTGFAAVPGPVVGAGLPGLVGACGCLLMLARRRSNRFA